MDPISQGSLGGLVSQTLALKKSHLRYATIIGTLAGLAPDLDILIRSDSDPLLFLKYHRQFTHSLFFIPFGSLIVATALYFIWFKKKLSFKRIWLYASVGYATHALLDCCTTYGTQWFWPLTSYRVSWSNISIIDPLFTVPLLFMMILSWKKTQRKFAYYGLVYVILYLLFGVVQQKRAEALSELWLTKHGEVLNLVEGNIQLDLQCKPSFANLILWRTIVEYEGHYQFLAVRPALFFLPQKVVFGERIDKLKIERDFPWIEEDSEYLSDIARFDWFSQGFLAVHPDYSNIIIDVRYSLLPHTSRGLWGISLPEKIENHRVDFVQLTTLDRGKEHDFPLGTWWNMIWSNPEATNQR